MFIDPWSTKNSLRIFLLKLKEDGELDELIKSYIMLVKEHRRLQSPSKGPYGEKGKDIVFCENEDNLAYCSYVVKWGTLQENLDGDYGILRQMRDAIIIPLEMRLFEYSRRTAIVVHNGEEKYRGAIDRFEKEKTRLENEIGALLLRPIERWDIDALVMELFPHREKLKYDEFLRNLIERQSKLVELNENTLSKARKIINESNPSTIIETKLILFNEWIEKAERIDSEYSLRFVQTEKEDE